jgi:protein TonB
METPKKFKSNDLESNRKVFLQIGFVIALAIVLVAFEWKSTGIKIPELVNASADANFDQDIAIITIQEEEPPPPKKKQEFKMVDDTKEVDDKVKIDTETSMNEILDSFDPIPEYEEPEVKDDIEEKLHFAPEEQPQFPGGWTKMYEYLYNNLHYPQQASELNVEGMVFVTYVVEKDGRITHVKIKRGLGYGCDEEAIRVIKEMPKWSPGRQMDRPVRTQFLLPVKFSLKER